ncbi:hypothetical protein NMY22_g11209 [Coprinellus aureogranulatus]|nr:hypothetical protein NMY22_g11209 [Coprinellus aureogranulatus]
MTRIVHPLILLFLLASRGVLAGLTPRQDASSAKECTVESANDLSIDDSNAILDAFNRCSSNSVIRFNRSNYTVYTPISLTGLQDVEVLFYGNWLLPRNVTQVQAAINATQNPKSTYATPWIYISGSNVEIEGASEQEFGGFYGFGEQWWHTGNRVLRPQLATFNVTNGALRNLKVIKPIAWGWNLPGQNIIVQNHYVDAAPGNATREDSKSFPFNTDGFNLSGKNITIDGYYGHNGDDCVSVINGAQDIVAKNGFCGFSSHGLSIGSLGRDGAQHTVKNVLFKNWTMDGAVYGARFKSWTGGRGKAENVTWEDITLVNVSTGIFITQNYYDQDKGPRPENTNKSSTEIKTMTFRNFRGSLGTNWTDGSCITQPCWNYVDGLDEPKAVILDLYPGTAKDISFQGIDIYPANDSSAIANVLCEPSALEDGADRVLGFKCQDGQFEETPVAQEDRPAGNGSGRSGNRIALFGCIAAGSWVVLAVSSFSSLTFISVTSSISHYIPLFNRPSTMKYCALILAGILPMAFSYEYRVGVGKDETTGRKGIGFDPSVIHPQAGDHIVFEFRSGVHSAVQSSFDNPCVGNGGFNSGVFTVSDDLAVDAPGLPTAQILINGTEPLWFFDEAGGLCHQGAVLAVNPTSEQTEVVFKENAAQPPKPASSTSSSSSPTATPSAQSDGVQGGNSNSATSTVVGLRRAGVGALMTMAGLAILA